MSSQARGRWCPIASGALWALAVAFGLAPAPAQGGCSRVVVSRQDPLAGLAQLELVDRVHHVDRSLAPTPTPDRPPPCLGFSCSRREPAPAPATAPVVRIDLWGLLEALPSPARRVRDVLRPTNAASRVLDRAEPIQRPPRVAPRPFL